MAARWSYRPGSRCSRATTRPCSPSVYWCRNTGYIRSQSAGSRRVGCGLTTAPWGSTGARWRRRCSPTGRRMRLPDDLHTRRGSAWRVLAILLACTGPLPIHAETPAPGLEPYTAGYQASYRGLAGGQVESSLRPGSAPGVWLYATRAFPNFLGRMAVSPAAREHGTMQISPARVRPLEFEFNDGTAEDAKDVRLKFDWNVSQATGVADGKPFTYDVEPGTQD